MPIIRNRGPEAIVTTKTTTTTPVPEIVGLDEPTARDARSRADRAVKAARDALAEATAEADYRRAVLADALRGRALLPSLFEDPA